MKGDAVDKRLKKMISEGKRRKIRDAKNSPKNSPKHSDASSRDKEYREIRATIVNANSSQSIVELSAKYSIQPNEVYNFTNGDTILHKVINCLSEPIENEQISFIDHRKQLVEELIAYGNDINILNKHNQTILDELNRPEVKRFWENQNAYAEMAEFLENKGAKLADQLPPGERRRSRTFYESIVGTKRNSSILEDSLSNQSDDSNSSFVKRVKNSVSSDSQEEKMNR